MSTLWRRSPPSGPDVICQTRIPSPQEPMPQARALRRLHEHLTVPPAFTRPVYALVHDKTPCATGAAWLAITLSVLQRFETCHRPWPWEARDQR